MNAVADNGNGNDNLRYAEYVLGVLDADTRAAVAHEVQTSSEAATAVAIWQRHLMPLAEEIAEVAPGPYVWARIRDALKLDQQPVASQPSRGLWNNLRLWHWVGIGASALAAACLVMIAIEPRTPPPAASTGYMVASINQDNGVTGWTATMDLDRARIVIVPASPQSIVQDRAPELWLIPAGQKPISVGVIARDKPITLTLSPNLLAQLGPTAALAVSVEPLGGSPTGQPTGPVIAKGAISGAPDAQPPATKVAGTDAFDPQPRA
jgi:anti-sigma-K factor RskA